MAVKPIASIEDKDVTYDAFDTARDLYYDLSKAYDEKCAYREWFSSGKYAFGTEEETKG